MKKALWIGVSMILISILISLFAKSNQPLNLCKCLLLAYGVCAIGYALSIRFFHHSQIVLYSIGVVFVCAYTILALDTYLFHALLWFPGILRYAMFSTYGWAYLLFLLPGVLLACHPSNSMKPIK